MKYRKYPTFVIFQHSYIPTALDKVFFHDITEVSHLISISERYGNTKKAKKALFICLNFTIYVLIMCQNLPCSPYVSLEL